MILRKPYAFLIKYFNLIHMFISILIIYLISKTNSILNFFKAYIRDDIFEVHVSEYVNVLIYLFLIVIIGLVTTMIILMRKKNKPLLIYIITVVFYCILFIGFSYCGSVISKLEYNLLDRKSISLVRDISRFMLIGQWLCLIPYVIRTFGFDIKKFDFKRDLHELEILDEDNEEFELVTPINMNKVEQFSRRRLRELKYYYIENKIFVLIFLTIIIAISIISVFNAIDFDSFKRYDEKEIIKLDNFYTLSIDDSYITTKNDSGDVIAVNDTFYLIVKFTVNSKYNGQFSLDTSKFIININDNEFLASRTYYNYFKSYGIGYKNQKFSLNDNKSYILVYNIPNKYKEKDMELEYNYKYDNSEKDSKMIKKIVKLEPEMKS